MLFGRAPSKESVPLPGLEAYLDRCFDGKVRRLAQRMPELEAALARSSAAFKKAIQEFSNSAAAPDMEYLRGLKEGNLESQKANYSSSLLHLLSSPLEYGGSCLYLRGKAMAGAYSSFITGVGKVNNSFRLVLIGYAGGLAEAKRQLTSMERLCRELENELGACSPEETEYRKLRARVRAMLENASEIADLGSPAVREAQGTIAEDGAGDAIKKQLEEREARHERAKGKRKEADASLAALLLPLERAARKHDHMSVAKIKLADYIKESAERIRNREDTRIIHHHLGEMAEEMRTGKIDAKTSAGIASRIGAVRDSDLLALAEASRRAAAEATESEAEMVELRAQLHALEKGKAERQRAEAERVQAEQDIGKRSERLSSEKKELEKLFLECYRKQAEIVIQ